MINKLSIGRTNKFYRQASAPGSCGRGVESGKGQVIRGINFTLPPLEVGKNNPYLRTRQAGVAAIQELKRAHESAGLRIPERALPWLDWLQGEAESLPHDENKLVKQMLANHLAGKFSPDQYALG
jgi:hypothetical protein